MQGKMGVLLTTVPGFVRGTQWRRQLSTVLLLPWPCRHTDGRVPERGDGDVTDKEDAQWTPHSALLRKGRQANLKPLGLWEENQNF